MRIIRGTLKGQALEMPQDASRIRPTLDRHRESIFNILEHAHWATDLQLNSGQWQILDLYCGTGALGLEAFSRGGSHVTFVDKDLKLCHQNISRCRLTKDNTTLIQSNVLDLQQDFQTFDLIFIDPPYDQNLIPQTLALLKNNLSPNAIIVIEHEATLSFDLIGFEEMRMIKTKKSHIRFLKL